MSHRAFVLILLITLTALTPRAVRAQGPSDPLPALIRVVSETSDEALQLDVLRGMKAGLGGRRVMVMPEGWDALEQRLGSSSNLEIRNLVRNLGLTFGSQRALKALRETLMDNRADAGSRRSALEGLVQVKDAELPASLRKLIADPVLRADALRSLAAFGDMATPEAILAAYPSFNVDERRDALSTLASRLAFARPLLEAIGAGRVPKAHLTAELVRQLRHLKNPEVNAQLEKLWGVTRDTTPDKRKEIDRYRRIYGAGGSTPGDASRGRKVFGRICQQCHTLFDTGGKVGPDLTGSNRGDVEYLLSNIVDPNAVIPNDYRGSTVELKDDRVLTGIVRQQDERTVTVITANETLVLQRGDVKSIQLSELSMMPEGLLAPLTDQEFRDLIYYLGRPGQVP
jgi:putative heme-binding domain-containing protein